MQRERGESGQSVNEPESNGETRVPDDPQTRPDEVVDALEQQVIGSNSREQREQDEQAGELLSEADSDAAEHPHQEPPS